MADDDAVRRLEARLTRLEAAMAHQQGGAGTGGAAVPGGAIVDPVPWGGGGWGGWGGGWGSGWGGWRPHPIVDPAAFAAQARYPGAVVDPGPSPWGGGWGGGWGGWRPHPIVDPAAFAQARAIVDPGPSPWGGGGWGGWGWRPHPIVDPAVFASAARSPGAVVDPPPIDFSRFSVEQLEATLHSINAEKARLASMESTVAQQLEKSKRQQG